MFKTEDGFELSQLQGQEIYCVGYATGFKVNQHDITYIWYRNGGNAIFGSALNNLEKIFAKKENAEQWAAENKPLSIADLMNAAKMIKSNTFMSASEFVNKLIDEIYTLRTANNQ